MGEVHMGRAPCLGQVYATAGTLVIIPAGPIVLLEEPNISIEDLQATAVQALAQAPAVQTLAEQAFEETHTCALAVKRVNCIPTVFPADSGEVFQEEDMLQVVYDNVPVPVGQL